MTQEQIDTYEFCKKYLSELQKMKKDFNKPQMFGCSSGCPNIERELEFIHKSLNNDIQNLISKTILDVNLLIKKA